jgi:translation initiation factor IF-3
MVTFWANLEQIAVDESLRGGALPVVEEGAPLGVGETAHALDHAREGGLDLQKRGREGGR